MSRGRLVFLFLSLTTVLFVAGTTMLAATNRQKEDGVDSLYKYLSVFTEVFSLVNRAYVDELDPESLMSGAFEGAVDALDPFSLYVPAEDVAGYSATLEVGRDRSGLLVLKERGVAYALAVEEGSPAAGADIAGGHILAKIQGRRTRKMPLHRIQAVLAGEPGTEIEVERILPRGSKETVKFELASYDPPAVELTVRRGVGVLRVPAFHAGTAPSVESSLRSLAGGAEALDELTESGKLVIDLRGVAGGDPAAAYRVAGFFAAGELGALQARGETLERFDGLPEPLWQGRVAVLVDRGTQGAAEVLAAVLQQSLEATLVGERSFGHSGRQRLVELSNGARLQVTDAFYTGPDRELLNASLEPDVAIRRTLADDDDDEPDDDDRAGMAVADAERDAGARAPLGTTAECQPPRGPASSTML